MSAFNDNNEIDIIEHPIVSKWFKELSKNEPFTYLALIQGNTIKFKKIFGTPQGETNKFLYWKKDYIGINIYIYTNPTDTYYKVQYTGDSENFPQDKKIGSYVVGFLNKLIKDLNNE